METTDLVGGRITSFRREQGFGVITLDDGTEVKFDAGICTMVPEEGAAVRLRVGPAKWGGGWKALYVEELGGPPIVETEKSVSLEDQLAAVQREHLVSGLTESIMDAIVEKTFEGKQESASILALLDAYYAGDPLRAKSDGYLRHGRRFAQETEDVLGELAALLPNVKLPRQISWTAKPEAKRDAEPEDNSETKATPDDAAEPIGSAVFAPAIATLRVKYPEGHERSVDIGSLDDIVELVNAVLRKTGDGRRVYAMQTGGEWHAYYALASDRAMRLATTLPFAIPPADIR